MNHPRRIEPTHTLLIGDVQEQLATLPADSVDCVVTSPPYWGLRDYGAEGQLGLEATPEAYLERMVTVLREVRRVLAAHGSLWLNVGDAYVRDAGVDRLPTTLGGPRVPSSWSNRAQPQRIKNAGPLAAKQLLGMPWRLAFALQADGWWLRADVIWSKPNPMPESVTDRPTKAHEYVFLLTKQPRYFYDAEAVREPAKDGRRNWNGGENFKGGDIARRHGNTSVTGGDPEAGHNLRSVWAISTQPYPEAHFATYPEELVRRCLLAGCPERVCVTCGKPSERIVKRTPMVVRPAPKRTAAQEADPGGKFRTAVGGTVESEAVSETVGWSDCGHNDYRRGRVLDPFAGSGTTLVVARQLGLESIGIELNPDYAVLIDKRMARWWDKPKRTRDLVDDSQPTLFLMP